MKVRPPLIRFLPLIFGCWLLVAAMISSLVPSQQALWLIAGLVALLGLVLWGLHKTMLDYQQLQAFYVKELDFAQQVMESVGHGLTVLDEHGRFVYVNKAYAELLGLSVQEVIGHTPYDFTFSDDHLALNKAHERRQQGEASSYQAQLRHRDGSAVPVVITGTPRWHAGRIVGNFAAVMPYTAVQASQPERGPPLMN